MWSEKIFYSSWCHGQNGEGFGSVEDDIFDGGRGCELGIGCGDDSIEVLEQFLHGDFERKIAADDFEWMVLGYWVGDFLFGCELVDLVELRL